MKNFIFGSVAALVVVGLIYMAYPMIGGFFTSGPVSPQELKSGVTDFGALQVKVSGAGKPLSGIEVDIGEPGGRMSYLMTDKDGIVLFENVPVGQIEIFFNDFNFPKEFIRVSSRIVVSIAKAKTTEKEIELTPKQ